MLNPNAHRTLLVQILKAIYTDPTLGTAMGFKGGTAAMLFYGLDRFSLDLDFDLLDSSKEKPVFEKIGKIMKQFGVSRDEYKKKYTFLFEISYETTAPNIKVEIHRTGVTGRYELKNYLGISMLVMNQEDMVANKLLALTQRNQPANRDLYDVWFFLNKNLDFNQSIIEKQTGLSITDYLQKCVEHVGQTNAKMILNGIGELLDPKQKKWAKDNLKSDTIFLLKNYQAALAK